mmetsp:Transcript_2908/g.3066  ORF Transcript_2908/g.3066 Transcript_2908/m.3066 type:complete len:342 (-) Transcript_2908:10-1035(-)
MNTLWYHYRTFYHNYNVEMFLKILNFIWSTLTSLLCYVLKGNNLVKFKSRTVRVGKTLGEGAFSFVYIAYRGNEQYALKKIFNQSSSFDKSVKAELEAFNRFHHPNILKILDSIEEDNFGRGCIVYMLFPLCKKGSLRNLLNKRMSGEMDKPNIKSIISDFRDICNALNVLHTYSPKYVHQDIKPENILISDDNKPLLTDFGSVRLAEIPVNTRAEALNIIEEAAEFCTISYRAPELFDPPRGSILDTRTDVWAVGCLLFAWFYGYSPFECEFNENGSLRVVECTHLRVLNNISKPKTVSENDQIIIKYCEDILKTDMQYRPYLETVITRLDESLFSANNV